MTDLRNILMTGFALFGATVALGMVVDFKGVPIVGNFDYFE